MYLLRGIEEARSSVESYIILGSTTKMTKSEVENAGDDGKQYVQAGTMYGVEDCLETMHALILAMKSSGWFSEVESASGRFVKFDQPTDLSGSIVKFDQPTKSAHSFELNFHKELRSILSTKEFEYVSLLKSNEQKDGMWMYKIVRMHVPLSLEPQLNEEVTSGNGVRYHVQDFKKAKCMQGTNAANIPLLSYWSTTDVDGLTVYHVSPLAEEAFETAFAFLFEEIEDPTEGELQQSHPEV